MTDSQIMARIFYYKGYQVLSEYYGGSVFFIVDYRTQSAILLLFKEWIYRQLNSLSRREIIPIVVEQNMF